nr:MAG TPA: hypothetical protein [Caudoviricetes sp.]
MFSTLLYTIEGTRKNTRLPGGFFQNLCVHYAPK